MCSKLNLNTWSRETIAQLYFSLYCLHSITKQVGNVLSMVCGVYVFPNLNKTRTFHGRRTRSNTTISGRVHGGGWGMRITRYFTSYLYFGLWVFLTLMTLMFSRTNGCGLRLIMRQHLN